MFPDLDIDKSRRIFTLLEDLLSYTNGANILISKAAKQESARLTKQGMAVTPFLLTEKWLRNISSIDGTVIIDANGYCHAFGVILDGLSNSLGLASRGGRYNSAVMYCGTAKHSCMIIVLSQDGSVDIIASKN